MIPRSWVDCGLAVVGGLTIPRSWVDCGLETIPRSWVDFGLSVVGGLITLRSGCSAITESGTNSKHSSDAKYFIISAP